LEYTVEIAPDRASLKGQLDSFRRLYRQTMDRVGADPFYYFSEDYFSAWTESLQPHCQIALVRAPDDTPAAAGLFTLTDGWMQYHLSGTNERYRKHAPSKLMLHRMRIQAQTSAVSHLHLGGGRGGSKDSLFSFKAGFASSRATFSSLRLVCDRVAYDALCRRDAPPISDGFFPAYRDE
jgi:lipid II:glycine glycyltransferase (peptidoglycan interpeptide bridge formation enzyme)